MASLPPKKPTTYVSEVVAPQFSAPVFAIFPADKTAPYPYPSPFPVPNSMRRHIASLSSEASRATSATSSSTVLNELESRPPDGAGELLLLAGLGTARSCPCPPPYTPSTVSTGYAGDNIYAGEFVSRPLCDQTLCTPWEAAQAAAARRRSGGRSVKMF